MSTKPEAALSGFESATEIAGLVRSGEISALDVVAATLARIAEHDDILNSFTDVVVERARRRASMIDDELRRGNAAGPLAGVPFAVKNLFDIEGLPTRAGSKINRERTPASQDAALIRRLEAAGAILVGGLNMGEYAYDFTGENVHDGPSRNPHDVARMSGGSSGGSGSAVAGGLVPFSLGSDTNGSIRVPSSFCGLFGLKPTYGRLTRAGTFPFVFSLDHLGPIARTVEDLALTYDLMQGSDPADPACTDRSPDLVVGQIAKEIGGLRIATAGGYFQQGAGPEALEALALVSATLKTTTIDIPEAGRARAAAYVITTSEGASLHLERLRKRPQDFDPAVRDRLIAGAMVTAPLVERAHKFRRWFRQQMLDIFRGIDAIIAPATPCVAPKLGETKLVLNGEDVPLRPNIGIFTQPISFIGLPVVAVPVALSPLPIALQVIAAPWREDVALRIAHHLEQSGIARVTRPVAFAGRR